MLLFLYMPEKSFYVSLHMSFRFTMFFHIKCTTSQPNYISILPPLLPSSFLSFNTNCGASLVYTSQSVPHCFSCHLQISIIHTVCLTVKRKTFTMQRFYFHAKLIGFSGLNEWKTTTLKQLLNTQVANALFPHIHTRTWSHFIFTTTTDVRYRRIYSIYL